MKPTGFRKPRTEKELRVKYRNELIDDRPRTADQMRWTDTGSDWDIVAVEYWEKKLCLVT